MRVMTGVLYDECTLWQMYIMLGVYYDESTLPINVALHVSESSTVKSSKRNIKFLKDVSLFQIVSQLVQDDFFRKSDS